MDSNLYLFLMKEMQVKSEFQIHQSIIFLDKNIQNVMGNKYLFSLGHDYNVNPATGEVDEGSE